MKTAIDTDNWRKKYFNSLSSIETEQRQYRAMEATLKRLAGRLCTASLGQSAGLDEQIRKLQTAIRRDVTSDELEGFTPGLTAAIQALDQTPTAAVVTTKVSIAADTAARAVQAVAPALPPAIPAVPKPPDAPPVKLPPDLRDALRVDDRVRAILATLLAELRRDTELAANVDALDTTLTAALTHDQFPALLSAVTDLVGQRIRRIEAAKQEVEVLLSHMVGKLDEIGQFVADQNRNHTQSQASSETLNVQLAGEMKAMGETVASAADLQQIRSQVRSRLYSIDLHLQAFRQRETTLASVMQLRNEQMRSQIAQMEAETSRLRNQLLNEQRLSTIDVLTRVPNRFAYDKRIEEELTRWVRFRQPTCLAVWDVDHFKRINDTYGHRAGDKVLHTVAGCLSTRLRATDFLARYGGEEFVMLLPGTDRENATRLIDDMRIAIAGIGFHFRGAPLSITISIGVTALAKGDSSGSAFDRADKAMYQAKATGRNRCVSG